MDTERRPSWAGTIGEIKDVSNLLPGCIYKHIGREANMDAHRLAQRVMAQPECVVMRYDMLEKIRCSVQSEVAREGSKFHPL
jgi:hypothetical protein